MFMTLSRNVFRNPCADRRSDPQGQVWPNVPGGAELGIRRRKIRRGMTRQSIHLISQGLRREPVEAFEIETAGVVAACSAKIEDAISVADPAFHGREIDEVRGAASAGVVGCASEIGQNMIAE